MNKLRKILVMLVFALVVVMGVNAKTENVKAASTKNFKGKLNTTYKNSEHKSKITIKKVNSKKVSVKIVINGLDQGKYNGKIISKDTIQINLDGEKVKFKWKDKTHFTAKPVGGFSREAVQMVRLLCSSLNNIKYTAKK